MLRFIHKLRYFWSGKPTHFYLPRRWVANAAYNGLTQIRVYLLARGRSAVHLDNMPILMTLSFPSNRQWNNVYQTPMQENSCLKLPQISNQLWCLKNEQHLNNINMDQNFEHQMSLSKSKCLYSNNCLCFLKCAVPLRLNWCLCQITHHTHR